mmetsp:Transcript_40314/g.67574  ORF Transcript_40314/g.67574 Transcript_40314/m.67574 type:complete len:404 (+) Transcript_40314:151-1362(+)
MARSLLCSALPSSVRVQRDTLLPGQRSKPSCFATNGLPALKKHVHRALVLSRSSGRNFGVHATSNIDENSPPDGNKVGMSQTELAAALRELDTNLAKAMAEEDGAFVAEEKALAVVRTLQEAGQLSGFGRGRGVPKRQYTLADLRLNNIDPQALLSPTDTTLEGVRKTCTIAAVAGSLAAALAFHWEFVELGKILFAVVTAKTVDGIVNGGGGEALLLDIIGGKISKEYTERVKQHEAGHFLAAYLLGVLPKGYTLSSLDAFVKYGALNVQAGTVFCDRVFQKEISKGRVSSAYVDQFSCIALAGVGVEYLKFGQAEGGLSDVNQMDELMRGLGFTQKKADDQVRYAVLNTVALLRQHAATHSALADAMARGSSVAECIQVIEANLDRSELTSEERSAATAST